MPTVKIYRVSVTGDNHSYVQWTECEGDTPPRQLINSSVRSILFEAQGTGITPGVDCSISKSSAATIEMVGDGNSNCSGVGNTLYPTTTTTTTTLAPVNFAIAPTCDAFSGVITVSSFSGGSGVYSTVAIGNTNGTSYNAATTNLSGAASYQWTGLTNGEWFITLRDNLGNHAVKPATVGCGVCSFGGGSVSYYGASSTTTTSTTTTTTTAAPTTTTTTAAPTTTTTTAAPTTTTTTAAPTTTTTAAPTTTTAAPTTTTAAPTTTTAAPTTTTAAPTTTTAAPATSTLYVYANDAGAAGNLILYAGVNGGAGADIWDESIDGNMPSVTCGLIYTFTATLAPGDTVTFSTSTNCVMDGDDSNSCPPANGGASTFTTAYMVAGANYVALGLNSSLFL